ncbi:MAG: HIT family protein [Ancrocorticia sp.]|jgi:diadenosine tetraphosphate (Ap4A) HIT family hydrolase|nr:HIT family protein [Ancrocorticia sp.]MCI1895313.1 HIT family protein [Ancrocorticia sp.]MCI1932080.1 HIT family protein [Ancrocorticia sp.]MCI1963441.1 HIT family protein [Ancrocorticia sp.]MCI2002365.1 HIT family protein [Ancrocorticia sp.]
MSVFSEIIAGRIPGRFAYADGACVVFATIEPIAHGHMLVVPRTEVAKFTDLPEADFAHLAVVAQRVGKAGEKAFHAPRAMVVIAGMEVPHVHLHVIPAHSEADIRFANAMKNVPDDVLDSDTEKLREALRELGYAQYVPADIHHLA